MEIGSGEFTVIVGRSGSGKTTLLNLAAGLTRPTSGRVTLDGVDLWNLNDQQQSHLRNRKIGFVFQFPSLLPTLTVHENVILPTIFGADGHGPDVRERAEALLRRVGLSDKLTAYPRQLSAGQQQRVVIARSLINQPQVLLADEPTSNLDEKTEMEIMDLFRDLHASLGLTIRACHAHAPARLVGDANDRDGRRPDRGSVRGSPLANDLFQGGDTSSLPRLTQQVDMCLRAFRATMVLVVAASMLCGFAAHAASPSTGGAGAPAPTVVIIYNQPPRSGGGLIQSSLRDPDGSATDQYAWDGFTLGWTQTITEVQWRGGYHPALLGSGGPVFDFTVDIYASIPGGSQPDIAHPPLVHYQVGGNASEAASEVLGGVQTYDYRFVLPAPFQAAAATKYWVQIEAFQSGAPDWGLSASMSGDGYYFRHLAEEGTYQLVPGDASFTLLGPGTAAYRVYLPEVVRG